jgi:hypothetical protein
MITSAPQPGPDALMLLGTHCPYCQTVLSNLSKLLKSGTVGRLEAVNIEQHPEVARTLGVRSVPWVRIGPFELEGLRSEQELRNWADTAGTETGGAAYLDELLSTGKIDRAIKFVKSNPEAIKALVLLFSNTDTQLNTRIGISAIIENLAGSELLQQIVDRLGELSRHDEPRIRGDAAHYLGLTGSKKAISYVKYLLNDADAGVREVARESLDLLKA